jgi:four helix bundle protein
MSRDYRKLKVFELADALVLAVYRATQQFPVEERFGLQSQIRRAAVSIAANIVEGCARTTTKDYLHFMSISLGSANEVRYLLDLSVRLKFLDRDKAIDLDQRYTELIASPASLVRSLSPESASKR